jgi:hypothetical protein
VRITLIAAFAAACIAMPARAIVIAPPDGPVTNPVSAFGITVDGLFTNPDEWSDVAPRAFISGPPLVPTFTFDSAADSFLYAALAPGVSASQVELYLMYDYKGRTNRSYASGDTIAEIEFPIVTGNLTVTLKGKGLEVPLGANPAPSSFFDVFFDVNGSPCGSTCDDLEVGLGFGPSFGVMGNEHLLVELEVPLNVPAGFFTGSGLPTGPLDGVYSPAPAFWNASAENDAGDPPISSAIFNINPDGSTLVCPSPGPCPVSVPAPSPLWLLGLGLAAMGWRRRRTA